MKKLTFVTPRYGANVGGGAEMAARGFAHELIDRGWHVEVWTTCSMSHLTWENVLPSGKTIDNGVIVRRFSVEKRNIADPHLAYDINGSKLEEEPFPQEYDWVLFGAQSPEMCQYIAQNGTDFDILIVVPYTFPAAHYAAAIYPERTIFWPCLHEELHAFLEPTRLLLETVAGVLFNAPEEQTLAVDRLGFNIKHHACLGCGVQFEPAKNVEWTKPDIPHLLYVGRLEPAKNVAEMYRFVQLYTEHIGEIHLTVVGKGPVPPPDVPYIDFRGYVSNEEKASLYASSTAHWSPSTAESFSLVTMESWLSGRPAIVNSKCSVPAGHVQRSKAGLAYSSFWEFVGAVQWIHAETQLSNQMGHNGKKYVQQNYTWPVIVERFEAWIAQWILADSPHKDMVAQ